MRLAGLDRKLGIAEVEADAQRARQLEQRGGRGPGISRSK